MPKVAKTHPEAPKRFKSSYICFSIAHQDQVKEELGPNARVADISKRMAQLWKSLDEVEKKKWDDAAKADRARYEEEKASYGGPWQVPQRRAKKDPNAPKRPMSAFLFFSQKYRPIVKARNLDLKNTDVSKCLGEMWRNAPTAERNIYIEREAAKRGQYKIDIARWKQEQALSQGEPGVSPGEGSEERTTQKKKKNVKPPVLQHLTEQTLDAPSAGLKPLKDAASIAMERAIESDFSKDRTEERDFGEGKVLESEASKMAQIESDFNKARQEDTGFGKETQEDSDYSKDQDMENEFSKAKQIENDNAKARQNEINCQSAMSRYHSENLASTLTGPDSFSAGNAAAAAAAGLGTGGYSSNNIAAAGNGAAGLSFSSVGTGTDGYSAGNMGSAGAGADAYFAGNAYAAGAGYGVEGLGNHGGENKPGAQEQARAQEQALLAMQSQFPAGLGASYGFRGGTGVGAYDAYSAGNYESYGGAGIGSGATAASLGVGASMGGIQGNLGGLGSLQNAVGLSQQGGGLSSFSGALQGNAGYGGANAGYGGALQGNTGYGGNSQGNAGYGGTLQGNAGLSGALQGNAGLSGALQGNAGASLYGYSPSSAAAAQQIIEMMGPGSGMGGLGGAGGMGY